MDPLTLILRWINPQNTLNSACKGLMASEKFWIRAFIVVGSGWSWPPSLRSAIGVLGFIILALMSLAISFESRGSETVLRSNMVNHNMDPPWIRKFTSWRQSSIYNELCNVFPTPYRKLSSVAEVAFVSTTQREDREWAAYSKSTSNSSPFRLNCSSMLRLCGNWITRRPAVVISTVWSASRSCLFSWEWTTLIEDSKGNELRIRAEGKEG